MSVKLGSDQQLTIVTFNHDLLVERVLEDAGVPYSRGFDVSDGEVFRFSQSNLIGGASSVAVRLIKLHGSIDWFLASGPDNHGSPFPVAKRSANLGTAHDAEGKPLTLWTSVPIFLTGYGKEMQYGAALYGDMHAAFLTSLYQTHTVITSGFGWNDRGVTDHIITWLKGDESRRVIYLHSDPDRAINDSRYLNYLALTELQPGQFDTTLRKYLSSTSINEILPLVK